MSIAIPARMSGLSSRASEDGSTAYDRPVGIAQRDPSAHRDQLVDEEQPVLEHLLEDQHGAAGLGGESERDRG